MRTRTIAATLALGLLAALNGYPGPVLGASVGTVRVVDDDGLAGLTETGEADCSDGWKNDTYPVPNTIFSKIADAVSAAADNDRIVICPGYYNESVSITKPLSIEGPYKGQGAYACAKRLGQATIIGKTDPALSLDASGISVDGIRIANSPAGGIRTNASYAGFRIRNNVIASSAYGILLASNGSAPTRIVRNCFRDDNNGAPGFGVKIAGALGDALIFRNQLRGHRTAGIQVGSATATNVRITGNLSLDERTFVKVTDATNVLIEGNEVGQTADISYPTSAILVTGTASAVSIHDNRIASTHSEAINVKDTANGIAIDANRITMVYDGISISTTAVGGATVTNNRITDISGTGIAAGSTTSGLTFDGNRVTGITRIACNDGSSGDGTAGTANTWTSNIGKVSAPDGICLPA